MKTLINDILEFKRRINFEIDAYIEKIKEIDEHYKKFSSTTSSAESIKNAEKLVSLKEFSEIYPSFSVSSLRSRIFTNEWNFEECVVRVGRKILIDRDKFEIWVRKPKLKENKYDHLGR